MAPGGRGFGAAFAAALGAGAGVGVGVAACAAAVALPLLGGTAQAATLSRIQPAGSARAARAAQAAVAPLRLAVTTVSPAYAQDGSTLTISGQVRNASSAAINGVSVQLWSSTTPLASRIDLVDYAHGSYVPAESAVPLAAPVATAQLDPGGSWTWTAHIPVSALGLRCFGVYPLTATVNDTAGADVATDPVPLPYWPTKAHACGAKSQPKPFPVSWIWPLIDTPHQGPCPGLLDNTLAASIAPRGRLHELLAIGSQYAAKAGLTWAIDPALLDNLQAMRHPYPVGGSPSCGPASQHPASARAAAWMAGLRKATAGQPVFVTPYADVDVGALASYGSPDLGLAFTDGDLIAHRALGRSASPASLPAGRQQLSALAWPPGGAASPSTLEKLAALHLSSVILTMPASSETAAVTPGAVRSYLTGIGTWLHVLLADHGLAALLASPAASSRRPGAAFEVSELFLAETAQIVAQAPSLVRPIVVTPPRRWDPSGQLASSLLSETVTAPWLSASTIGQIESQPDQRSGLPPYQATRGLSRRLLQGVARLDAQIALLQSIRVSPNTALYHAVFGIESSSWRGRNGKLAKVMLDRTQRYVDRQLGGLAIIGSPYVTLGGKVSTVPVVIRNTLGYSVRVKLVLHATNATVTLARPSVLVHAHSYSAPLRLIVHANGGGQGIIRLSLTSPGGAALPVHLVMHVKPTEFGAIVLVICAAVLAVFVIASAARALRHGRPEARAEEREVAEQRAQGEREEQAERAEPAPFGAGQFRAGQYEPAPVGPGPAGPAPGGPERLGPERLGPGPPNVTGGLGSGPLDTRGRLRYADNVVTDGPELRPADQPTADQPTADQESAAPGRRPTEER